MTVPTNPPQYGDNRTITVSRQMLATGAVLAGRYRIIELIGAGGMGMVYRAYDSELQTEIALKILTDQFSSDPEAVEQFKQEIRLARQVSHPNVVRIHDIGSDGKLVFMTMDLVPGRTLVARLVDGPLAPAEAVAIAMQVAEALGELHRYDIVHRDIKPSNILLDDSGNAWLSDFGIACAIDQQQFAQSGKTVGTVAYMAPEQIRGDVVNERADLYALGLVLWEMLTGRTPLKGNTEDETIARRLDTKAQVNLAAETNIPRALVKTVRRCLEPQPEDRYPSAADLRDDLARSLAGLNWKKRLRRTGWLAALIGAVVIAAIFLPDLMKSDVPTKKASLITSVLPVVNATGNEDLNWVRSSLTESITSRLSENPNLSVIEPLRVRRILADLRLVTSELDHEHLLQLAELLSSDRLIVPMLLGKPPELRLQVKLIDPADSEPTIIQFDLAPEAILAGTDLAAERIINALEIPVTSSEATNLPMSANLEALSAFDTGIEAMVSGDHQTAIDHLVQAVELDPAFGMAWIRLADARSAAGFYNEAVAAAQMATKLLEGQHGHAEAWVQARYAALAGQTERAIALFEHLIDAYPTDVDAKLALAELLAETGQLEPAITLADQVTSAIPNHPRAWFLLGKFAVMFGDVQRAATDYFVKALVIQNRLGSPAGRAEVLNGLGIAHERLGDLDTALGYYRESTALHREAGDQRGQAASLSNLGRVNMIQGRFEDARSTLKEALSIRNEIGDLHGLAQTNYEFGGLEEDVGNYIAARDYYRNALRIHEQLGNTFESTSIRMGLAFTHLMLGEYDTAEVFAQRALDLQTEAGDIQGQMSSLQILGELGIARGNWNDAQALLLRALEIARKIENPFGEAAIHGSIGLLASYQGRIAAALDAYDTAISLLQPLDDQRGLFEYHLRYIETLEMLGLLDIEQINLTKVRGYFDNQINLSQHARLIRLEAVLDAAHAGRQDKAAKAGRLFDKALQLALASGNKLEIVRIRLSKLRWLGGSLDEFEQLASSGEQLGNRPIQLQALALLAEKQIDNGNIAMARQTILQTLRPPLALEEWVDNWHLYAISEQTADPNNTSITSEEQSKVLLIKLAESLPVDLQPVFRQLHGL